MLYYIEASLFLLAKFRQKAKLNIKNSKKNSLLRFWVAKSETNKKFKFLSDSYIWFHCVTKNIEGWLNTYTSYLVYSHIWLNLAKDDHHFFYNFPWMMLHFGYKQKFLDKKIPIEAVQTLNQQFHHHIPKSVSKIDSHCTHDRCFGTK
jgi:hypothetical protein